MALAALRQRFANRPDSEHGQALVRFAVLSVVLAYLYAQRGRLFDPRCVEALLRSRDRLDDICQRFSTTSARPALEA